MSLDDDHIPLKDQFSVDESDIEIDDKEQEAHAKPPSQYTLGKKIKKKSKVFAWKYRWVKIPNAMSPSAPLLIRKWVKVKLAGEVGDNCSQKNDDQN